MYHKVFTVILRKSASGFLELTACNFTVFLKKIDLEALLGGAKK